MDTIVRLGGVLAATGLSKSTVYAQIAAGVFPKPIRLGPRAVGWRRADIEDWIASRPTA